MIMESMGQHLDTGIELTPELAGVDIGLVERIHEAFDEADNLLNEAQKTETAVAVSIILPVYNEQKTLRKVVERVVALPIHKEILIVDDGSTDGTSEVVDQLAEIPEVRIVRHERNRGKGAALRSGLQMARGEVVVVQDADLEYDPTDIMMLIGPILANRCDVVYGSRYLAPVESDGWVHRNGNQFLTRLSNMFTGQQLTDMETCYKAVRRSVFKNFELKQYRVGIEPELTAKLSRCGKKIYEMPIAYKSRGYADGKKIGLRDAFKAVWCILRYGLAQ